MKSADKYLVMIVVGVLALVAVAFTIVLLRPKPTYLPEDTPEGIANNYLFALQQDDYERAYGYISTNLEHYPASVTAFTENIHRYHWRDLDNNRSPSLRVESARINKDRAIVMVRKTSFYAGGLFHSGQYTSTFTMTLVHDAKTNGPWKIEASDDYWAWCWHTEEKCE